MNMSLVLRLHGKCIFADPLQMSHHCYRFWKCYAKPHLNVQSERPKVVRTPCAFNILTSRHKGVHFFHISTSKSGPELVFFVHLTSKCASRHNGMHFFHISTSKSGPELVFLYILTSKRAARHNGVHFFDISTSKSGPNLVCFVHFDFEMCFAPQRRAIFHCSSGQLAPHPPL